MIKDLLIFTLIIGVCYSAVIKDVRPELESKVPENAVEEINDNQPVDLDTAEGKHFGPRVVVINKGYGYGGQRGCGCGGYGGSSHYHSHHRYYGKK